MIPVRPSSILTLLASVCALSAQPRPIDTAASTITVRVFKAGVFSALGHDHQIAAAIARGSVDPTGHQVELTVRSAQMQVRDSGISDKDRSEIQTTMLGPEVLNAEHFPDISFRSTSAESTGSTWKVSGNLTLHGQTRPVTVDVKEAGGHYSGTARLKLTDFDIKPIRLAGGTVRVKDEVRIEFDIQLARSKPT